MVEKTFEFKLEEEDLVYLNLHVSKKRRRYLLIYSIVAVILMFLLVLLSMGAIGFFTLNTGSIIFYGLIIAMAAMNVFAYIKIKRLAIKFYRTNKRFKYKATVYIKDDEIITTTEVSENRYPWSDIIKYESTEKGHLLYAGYNQVVMLPKRFLYEDDNSKLETFFNERCN